MTDGTQTDREQAGEGTAQALSEGAGVTDPLERFPVGTRACVRRTITAEDVAAFARLSGDTNPLHVDAEFAARTEFERPVVHGFLHASLLSTLVGMKIPGEGALYLSQTIDFTRPVFIGDTVEARGEVTAVDRATRTLTIATEIVNQKGETVLRGEARARVMRPARDARVAIAKKGDAAMGDLLAGKVALVTGASRGIGRAIAATLAAHGAMVWINYHRSESAARTLAEEIGAAGGAAETVRADVTDEAAVRGMLATVTEAGALDILVNNAGPKIVSAPFDRLGWADMADAYAAIVGSAFAVIQAALPALEAARGRIVNVLSSAPLARTAPNWLPYVAAKGGLLAMSKNLAQELGPRGVRVNMVSPSMVDTDLTADIPDRIRQMMVARTPLRRLASPEDVAGAVLFLASPLADFVTGDNLLVTGGEVMP